MSLTPSIADQRKLAVFTDFWYLLTKHQILHNLSDTALASSIGVSDNTWRAWRRCIKSDQPLRQLRYDITKLPRAARGTNVRKIRLALAEQTRMLRFGYQILQRSGSGIPTEETFNKVVGISIKTALLGALEELFPGGGLHCKMIADRLGAALIELYDWPQDENLDELREIVQGRITQVAKIASEIAVCNIFDMPPSAKEYKAQQERLYSAAKDAKQDASIYAKRMTRQIGLADVRSEKSAFISRLEEASAQYKIIRNSKFDWNSVVYSDASRHEPEFFSPSVLAEECLRMISAFDKLIDHFSNGASMKPASPHQTQLI